MAGTDMVELTKAAGNSRNGLLLRRCVEAILAGIIGPKLH